MTSTERFLNYIKYHTTSDPESSSAPSTNRQLVLAELLEKEMMQLGIINIHRDHCGNVIGTLPSSTARNIPAVAFIAHMDTAPDASGKDVKARSVLYTGEDIQLGSGHVLSETMFPFMKECRGKHLIVTDGTTLLGADDKAGIAEILTMVEILNSRGLEHGELRIIFTTDEEIGRGAEGLDPETLCCGCGFTVDGGELGIYEYENFNAASARIHFKGVGIHPGSAKNIMKNAAAIATEFHSMLPAEQVPEKTEGYEGFIHLNGMKGEVEEAELHYIIRDHDKTLFEEKKALVLTACDAINKKYGPATACADIADTYYNMKEIIDRHPELPVRIEKAYSKCGIPCHAAPIRGGTDGAVLSWEGLPCPNLSTGGYNYHGVYEFIPEESLEAMPEVLTALATGFLED